MDVEKNRDDLGSSDATIQGTDAEVTDTERPETALEKDQDDAPWDWDTDPTNPWNWPSSKKWRQVAGIASVAFTTSVATSVMSPARSLIMQAFSVSSTVAILPLSLYVLALGLGPVVGGPLSETVGRVPIYVIGTPLGMLFSIGAALCPESTSGFAGLCVLRFLAGLAFSPNLAVGAGVLGETFRPAERGLPVLAWAPVFGAFAARKGWRWPLWTVVFFSAFSIICIVLGVRETYHPVLRRRRAHQLGISLPDEGGETQQKSPLSQFLSVGLIRPLHMLVAEPIVALTCLYVACEFATLFSFFAGVPYTFAVSYHFSREQSGLVFLAIVVGSFLGLINVILCDVLVYRRRLVPRYPPHGVPPEHRLYAAMIGSVGLPIGLFWMGWTADQKDHWAAPVVAIVPFAWGNISIFVSLMQYLGDAYHGSIVASASSANSLARYGLASVFPLFTLQMYEKLGIGWATSLLGFIALALMPLPWLFFRYGPALRARSRYS